MSPKFRIQEVIRAGAYYGAQPLKLVEHETISRSPADSIIDRVGTEAIRRGSPRGNSGFLAREAQKYRECLQPIVHAMLRLGETYYDNIVKKGYLSGVRAEDMEDKDNRLKLWVQTTDKMGRELMETVCSDMASYLTPRWYTWQSQRLRWVLGFEWGYQKAKCGSLPTWKKASQDFHDMQYVAYLVQADGLLTKDKRLVTPLARAAFPDKIVCPVLEDYASAAPTG